MKDLDKLLEQAEATKEQRAQMHRLFEEHRRLATIRPVAIEPTIHKSLDLSSRTILHDEDEKNLLSLVSETKPTLGRYVDLGLLGRGGMGEVRRVLDPTLNRRMAMKIIHARFLKVEATAGRFVEEAKIVAQLQHPNIIPIHEIGGLEDGRLYFTMKEVEGKPFSEIIQEVHAASTDYAWQSTADGWNFRKLIHIFSKVCAATAFAHSCGVVHRDLKPENVLVGKFDEVLLVDWGIAKIVTDLQDTTSKTANLVEGSRAAAHLTRMGEVAGTPAYMAPEQARGLINKIDSRTDVYGLGAILYEILSGRCPYGGSSSHQVLSKVIFGPPPSIRTTVLSDERITHTIELDFFNNFEEPHEATATPEIDDHNEQGLKLPDTLIDACEKAMQRSPNARFQQAEDFQQVIVDWLDGAKQRDQAMKVVTEAEQVAETGDTVSKQIGILQQQAKEAMTDKAPWSPDEEFLPGWTLEDKAKELQLESQLLAIQQEQLLQGALTHANELEEAHLQLVELYKKNHATAERANQAQKAAAARLRMEFHSNHLAEDHPVRIQANNYLEGRGQVSIVTENPGAEVYCSRFTLHNRRLVLSDEVLLGHTPLHNVPIEMGSYSLRIRQEGFDEITYPINIVRQGNWSGCDPNGKQIPISLPAAGTLADDECFVPAGPFICGGDEQATEGLPAAQVWVDSFIIKKYQVTYQEYQTYLQSLHDEGRHQDFQTALPVHDAAGSGTTGKSCFELNPQGKVQLVEDSTGQLSQPDWPIAFVSYRQAVAYAKWLAEKTGQQWRILNEYEWEKAARGVDGRFHPWGSNFSAAWTNCNISQENKSPVAIQNYPVDCSVYGVHGMAGNLSQWTSSAWVARPDISGFVHVPKQAAAEQEGLMRTFRGGGWMLPEVFSRSTNRVGFDDTDGVSHVGFRVGRTP